MPKPVSDLERYLAGEFAEQHDVFPAVALLIAIAFVVVAVCNVIQA